MSKTISVIIPVYNVEEYLEECLESVVNQSLENIEVICINDGSTDNSYDILKKYSIKYNNIKIISQKNKGLSVARNEGLKIATGKYVYFVDSDDILIEGALKKIWEICEEKELDVLYFSFKNISESEGIKEKYNKHFINIKRSSVINKVVTGKEMLDFFCVNNEYYVNVWLQVLNREFLLKNNIYFYDGIIYEDNLYTFDVLTKSNRAYCINDVLYLKRIRENSIVTGKQNSESARGFLITIIEILSKIKTLEKVEFNLEKDILFILKGLIMRMNRYYNQLDDIEKNNFINKCTLEEKIIFELLQEKE